MKASDIMTPDVISADPDATVLQAARYMLQHHISGLPVIDKRGTLVGILSEGDFLRRRETSHRPKAVALARVFDGARQVGCRIYPYARKQGFRSNDDQGACGHRRYAARKNR